MEKPSKMFLKLPANYSELSEQERKEWVAATAQAIVQSLSRLPGECDAPDKDRKSR